MWLHGPACLEVDSSWPAQSIPIDLFSLSLNNICQVSVFSDATGKMDMDEPVNMAISSIHTLEMKDAT
jgi:hypothetical protein